MNKFLQRIFLLTILSLLSVEILSYFTLQIPVFPRNENTKNLRASESSVKWSGNILLEYNNYYEIYGFVDRTFSFNFNSIDSNNGSVYVDLIFLVMEENTYNTFLFSLNHSNNLFQVTNSHPIRDCMVGGESHHCGGSYYPTQAQTLHMVFINLDSNQKTSSLTYSIQFEEKIGSEPDQGEDEDTYIPIEVLPGYTIIFPLLILVGTATAIGTILTFIIVKNYSNHHKLQIEKTLGVTQVYVKSDPVLYCSWCGFKLVRVVKYCPRCGKEIEY
ncbi:MAG: hypothetical protein EAX91_04710 [Candidatus Lokiarchaeota archaeon]|nr:hypothetical protein [Candidatus Lokiarchaeota archaeon]